MIKQEFFEKKVFNQEEIDQFWKNLVTGNREKVVEPMAADKESTKKFVERINKWIISNQSHIENHKNIRVDSVQYNEDLSECVVVYER